MGFCLWLGIRHELVACPSVRGFGGLQRELDFSARVPSFELTVIQIIHYWSGSEGINNAAWIVPLLFALTVIQYFGIRGYGEVGDYTHLCIRH